MNCDGCETDFRDYGIVARAIVDTSNGELDFKARYSEVDAGSLAFNASLALIDAAALNPLFYAVSK